MSSCEDKPEAKLCAGGCGFFGSAATEDFCSLCYKMICSVREEKMGKSFDASSLTAMLGSLALELTVDQTCTAKFVSTPTRPLPPVPKERCDHCNKKVRLLGFVCKCGNSFCGTHRYPEKHVCGFDYKSAGRAIIAAANPLIKKDKLVDRI